MFRSGFTFSQLQCQYLGLDYQETFKAVCELNPKVIRLCAYWNEIEPQEGEWHFEILEWLLKKCDQINIDVVLALGMKSPRWPEFHFPKWIEQRCNVQKTEQTLDSDETLKDHTLHYIQKVVEQTKHYSSIKYFQIENEALGKVGIAGDRCLSTDFLEEEINLVRKLKRDDQKIVLTCAIDLWPPLSSADSDLFLKSVELGDAVGVNVYTKVPTESSYLTPTLFYWRKLKKWSKHLEKLNKESWISELQAEPWEHGGAVHLEKMDYPSATPEQTKKTFEKLKDMGYQTILLWGVEYWYWQKVSNQTKWWDEVTMIFPEV